MTKTANLLTTLCICLSLSRAALAWNGEGHMVVAQIAYNHLDPEVRARCDMLVTQAVYHSSSANSNFVTAACWADDIKSFTSAYSTWHYIDLAVSLTNLSEIITNSYPPPSTNVVWAIQQCISTLQNPASTLSNQAVALRFLLHFVGDIQQPLHCADGYSASFPSGDAGGNGFTLTGDWSNLHSLWDAGGGFLADSISRPIANTNQLATLTNKAAAVESAYPYSLSVGTIPDPMVWAQEGWNIARTNAYVGITINSTPTVAYTNQAQATTVWRMAMGGQRLAKLLNTIMVTNPPVATATTLTSGNFTFSWGTVSGRAYRVQCKQQITDAVWSNLTDIIATTNSITFTNAVSQPQQFYRAIVVN